MNFGDIHRSLREVHSRIISATDSRSALKPWNSSAWPPATVRE
jgi:hypothetical protein